MANFAGQMNLFPGQLDPANRSRSVTAGAFAATLVLSLATSATAATRGVPQPSVSVAHRSISGQRVQTFGGQLFEKVIVIPRVKALGFVLTATQFAVAVWNTFRDSNHTLQSIPTTCSGWLSRAHPYVEPHIFPSPL